MKYFLCFTAALLFYSCDVTDNNPVNKLSGLKLIDIIAENDDLERLFNNRQTSLSIPVKIIFEDELYQAELRASGGGSRYYPKFSFRVILETGTIMGIREFSLSAQPSDPTYIKTAVASYLYESYGFPVFFSEPVFVTLNNKNYGIYNFVERINEEFFVRRNLPVKELYQVQFEAKFSFLKVNNLQAGFDKEIPDDDNYSSLADLINASDSTPPENILHVLGNYMDIDNYLIYHAISTIRNDPDSFSNNFYIYKRSYNEPFMFIPWDFDKSFTGRLGLYGYNELIESLLRNVFVSASYKAKLKELAENTFKEENLYPIIDEYYSRIEPYYSLDPYLLNGNSAAEVNELKEFISIRRKEILELLKYD